MAYQDDENWYVEPLHDACMRLKTHAPRTPPPTPSFCAGNANAQQNFRIFWVSIHSKYHKDN